MNNSEQKKEENTLIKNDKGKNYFYKLENYCKGL